jgi:hypothetical protein
LPKSTGVVVICEEEELWLLAGTYPLQKWSEAMDTPAISAYQYRAKASALRDLANGLMIEQARADALRVVAEWER